MWLTNKWLLGMLVYKLGTVKNRRTVEFWQNRPGTVNGTGTGDTIRATLPTDICGFFVEYSALLRFQIKVPAEVTTFPGHDQMRHSKVSSKPLLLSRHLPAKTNPSLQFSAEPIPIPKGLPFICCLYEVNESIPFEELRFPFLFLGNGPSTTLNCSNIRNIIPFFRRLWQKVSLCPLTIQNSLVFLVLYLTRRREKHK